MGKALTKKEKLLRAKLTKKKYYYKKWRSKLILPIHSQSVTPEKGREAGRRWREAHPDKFRARWLMNNAVKKGILKRPKKCSFCQQPGEIQGHIVDIEKPLEVEWLCSYCNREKQRRKRREIWKEELKELGL